MGYKRKDKIMLLNQKKLTDELTVEIFGYHTKEGEWKYDLAVVMTDNDGRIVATKSINKFTRKKKMADKDIDRMLNDEWNQKRAYADAEYFEKERI